MNYKVTIGIYNANSIEEAEKQIDEMLNAYDLHNFSDVEINLMEDSKVEEM